MSFNVTVYGAVGDGLTDDRLAIQNAIDACSAAGGGDVYFPVGIYLVSQNGTNAWCIRIYSNVRLLGESRGGSVLKQSSGIGASVRLIYASGKDCAVSTLTLDGNKAAQSVNEHRHGIFAHLTERLLVEHVTSHNFTGDGFYLYIGANDSAFSDVHVTANDRNGLTMGAEVSGVRIINSKFIGSASQQIDSEPGAGNHVRNVLVSGCQVEGNGYCITCSGTGSNDADRGSAWTITGNIIRGSINVTWCDDVSIAGNVITNPTTHPCVYVYRTSNNITITGNRLKMTQTSTANVAAVFISGTTNDYPDLVEVGDNVIDVAEASGFGVRAEGSIAVAVTGNLMRGAGVSSSFGAGIYFRTTTTAMPFRSAIAIGNTIRNFGKYGLRIAGNSTAQLLAVDISNNIFDDTAGTMTTGIALDDTLNEAKRVTIVGNQCIGGVTTAVTSYPTGPILIGGVRGAGGIYSVHGTPDGVVTEKVGAMALRRDGGAGTTLYVKQSGTGNTGWVAK